MAEVKNVFIKSKMNLDLDSRLVPSGEYRQGFNIQVSKSEGADVGALENVLGNEILADFATISGGGANTQIIGQFTNVNNDTIYIYLTNNTDNTYLTSPSFNTAAGNYIYSYNVLTGDTTLLVTGPFLNFSTTNPIYGINMIENLLFWTDNRNQPRKINVNLANPNRDINPTYYTNEDQISVTKYYPFQAINLYKANSTESPTVYETTMYDVVSETLPDGTTLNPYFQGTGVGTSNVVSTYPGDPDFLQDKFVRFSYRFKYDDNEYSPFATFTQACFIPKQDGFFLGEDEKEAYRSTVVSFMENKVNEILLQIPLPTAASNLASLYKISEIDILYKEADRQTVEVVDTILQTSFASLTNYTINNQNFIEYKYQGTKPFKTLPESNLIRVFDKSPVKALAQEISGNRIIYGNYQDQHTPPATLDYNVNVSAKSGFSVPIASAPAGTTSYIEYPNSTVKQNRNYQVGVVLADRYGRSSSVILSSNQSQQIQNTDAFDVSTVFHNYRTSTDQTAIPITSWPGDSIKVLFNTAITSSKSFALGNPGLYVGSPSSSNYNPLGWYSYKIVVKQFEQDYYNVYLPGILRGYPKGITTPDGDTADSTAFITLINDNINKVPRDLSEVGPEQKQYRSSVQLYGRVTPEYDATAVAIPTFNEQFNPGIATNTVNTIGEQDFVLGNNASPPIDYVDIYQTISNPYLGRITQVLTNPIGGAPAQATAYNFFLGVYETAPVESRLNIYYETSTSGIISELNTAIQSNTADTANGLYGYTFSLTEATPLSTEVSSQFGLLSPGSGDAPIQNGTLTLVSVVDGAGTNIQLGNNGTYFNLVSYPGVGAFDPTVPSTYDKWALQTTREFYYGPTSLIEGAFTFNFLSGATPLSATGTLQNIAPTISPKPSTISLTEGVTTINTGGANFSAVNGTIIAAQQTSNLEWSITSQPAGNFFSINSSTAVITVSGNPAGANALTIQVKDAGGATDSFTTSAIFGEAPINIGFGKTNEDMVSNTMYSQGGTSLAIYWTSDATNANANQVLDGTLGGYNSNALVLPTTLPGSPDGYLNKVTTTISTGTNQIEYANSQYNALGTGATQSQGGLTAGTAYIRLNISFTNDTFPSSFNSTNSQSVFPYAMFPIVLQYRATGAGANAWVTATDIEGNAIQFGGTQKNQYSYYNTVSTSQQSALQSSGALANESSATNYNGVQVDNTNTNPGANQNTSAQIYVGSINSQQGDFLQSTISKTFAFGTSESYSASSKLGDYRLIIRYPYGVNGSGSTSDYIVPGKDQFPVDDWYGSSMFDYSIDWGDFYYPNGSSATNYAYRVSFAGYNAQNSALQDTPDITLYAREWMGKYVSQFYTDAALTQAWSPNNWSESTGWHSYSALDNAYVANNGMEFSNFINNNSTNYTQIYTDSNRRWTAFFESTGIKRMGTAIPSVTNS